MSYDSNGEQPWLDPDLREKGRQRLKETHPRLEDLESEETRQLLENLELHRAELWVQNEELREAQQELTRTRDAYRDLFERAPVGYLILDGKGRIEEANLRAEDLLEVPRSQVEEADFADFVASTDQDAWFLLRRSLAPGMGRLVEELTLRDGPQGSERIVRLEAVVALDTDPDDPRFRCALSDITQRRQAERALKRERDHLEERVVERTRELREAWAHREKLLENLGEGVIGFDHGGRINFVNPMALEMLGYESADQLMGREASEALRRPESQGPAGTRGPWLVPGVMESGNPKLGYEDRFCRADGQTLHVEVFATPIYGGSGAVQGAVLAFADITERKSRQFQAERDGQALRHALADTGLAHWSWDLVNDRQHWSEDLYRLLGLDPAASPPSFEALMERLHPDDAATLREALEKARTGDVPLLLDFRVRRPDGQWRSIRLQGAVGRNPSGEIVRLSGVAQDVTDTTDSGPEESINLEALTLREREVLSKLAQGLTNKEVACEMGLSPRTVEEHRARIMEKLGVRSFAELIPIPR